MAKVGYFQDPDTHEQYMPLITTEAITDFNAKVEELVQNKSFTDNIDELKEYIDTVTSNKYVNADTTMFIRTDGDNRTITWANSRHWPQTSAIDLNNSDIIGFNSIVSGDTADYTKEGIVFKRSDGGYDCITALNGVPQFCANNSTDFVTKNDTNTTPILTVNNIADGIAPTIQTNNFVVTNGTSNQFLKADGSLDSNIYTIEKTINNLKGDIVDIGSYFPMDMNLHRLTIVDNKNIVFKQATELFDIEFINSVAILKNSNIIIDTDSKLIQNDNKEEVNIFVTCIITNKPIYDDKKNIIKGTMLVKIEII